MLEAPALRDATVRVPPEGRMTFGRGDACRAGLEGGCISTVESASLNLPGRFGNGSQGVLESSEAAGGLGFKGRPEMGEVVAGLREAPSKK